MSELATVLPTHRHPVVCEAVLPALKGKTNVAATEPMTYGEFIRMLSVADVPLTDPAASPATIAAAGASRLPMSRRSASTTASVPSPHALFDLDV